MKKIRKKSRTRTSFRLFLPYRLDYDNYPFKQIIPGYDFVTAVEKGG